MKSNILLGCSGVVFSFLPVKLLGENEIKPNVIFVFADQLRLQSLGYAGDPNVYTPNIDKFCSESLNFKYAISGMPVSTPYRGIMLTGQRALTNGMFMNDIQLDPNSNSFGKIFKKAGYNTGYIGKWHLNGNGRSSYIKKKYRQGFEYFKALECSHDYMKSAYYDNDCTEKKYWDGYDVISQTDDAIDYIKDKSSEKNPFLLFLSWGTPHNPYNCIPQKYAEKYENKDIKLRMNVPDEFSIQAIKDLKGYYSHITAMDESLGRLLSAVESCGISDNTIFVFTSDHGDMLYSQGLYRKQKPYDESIRVPFLLRYPNVLGKEGREINTMIDAVDILPTILGLCGICIPETIQGENLTPILKGEKDDYTDAVLLSCVTPFGEYSRNNGGKEYRGIRTRRYTYVRDLNGSWLLYDNFRDPYQLNNLVDDDEFILLRDSLDSKLNELLEKNEDEFKVGDYYIKKWGYLVDETGTVPYEN